MFFFFIPARGSSWRYSGFSPGQNNHDLSGAYVLRSERKNETRVKHHMACKDCGPILFAFVSVCGR